MNSVQVFWNRVKAFFRREDVFIILLSILFLLIIIGAFVLYTEKKQAFSVTVEEHAFPVVIHNVQEAQAGEYYMASKNGTKYYPKGCASGNRIKEENRIYFASVQEAISAGYELAKNCP